MSKQAGELRRWHVASLNPFGSWRDVWLWIGVVVGSAVCVGALIRVIFDDAGMARGALIGALIAALGMRALNIAVATDFPAERMNALAAQLRALGYTVQPPSHSQVFAPNAATWLRWDSNRVVVSDHQAYKRLTCPLFLMPKLRSSLRS